MYLFVVLTLLGVSGLELGVPLGVELELLLFVDVVILLGVLVLSAAVGVDVITWVVSVGPSTVQVYKQSISIIFTYIRTSTMLTLHATLLG